VQSVHAAFAADWTKVFDLRRAMESRSGTGMPGPAQVRRQLTRWRKALAD
jgi:argininosuccinate lyase